MGLGQLDLGATQQLANILGAAFIVTRILKQLGQSTDLFSKALTVLSRMTGALQQELGIGEHFLVGF